MSQVSSVNSANNTNLLNGIEQQPASNANVVQSKGVGSEVNVNPVNAEDKIPSPEKIESNKDLATTALNPAKAESKNFFKSIGDWIANAISSLLGKLSGFFSRPGTAEVGEKDLQGLGKILKDDDDNHVDNTDKTDNKETKVDNKETKVKDDAHMVGDKEVTHVFIGADSRSYGEIGKGGTKDDYQITNKEKKWAKMMEDAETKRKEEQDKAAENSDFTFVKSTNDNEIKSKEIVPEKEEVSAKEVSVNNNKETKITKQKSAKNSNINKSGSVSGNVSNNEKKIKVELYTVPDVIPWDEDGNLADYSPQMQKDQEKYIDLIKAKNSSYNSEKFKNFLQNLDNHYLEHLSKVDKDQSPSELAAFYTLLTNNSTYKENPEQLAKDVQKFLTEHHGQRGRVGAEYNGGEVYTLLFIDGSGARLPKIAADNTANGGNNMSN